MENVYEIGIIGGGPAGYNAAIRACQKGFKVVLFEKDCVGGTCLNRGCIPTKTILHCTDLYKNLKKADKFGITITEKSIDYEKIYNRKNDIVSKINKSLTKLIESHSVKIVNKEAEIISDNKIKAEDELYECKNIIIATGSKPTQVTGLECDGEFIFNSNQILELTQIPENILIVGSGAIGVEWARIFSALDKNVTIVELAEQLLPIADEDISKRLDRVLKKNKIKIFTNTKIENTINKTVTLSNGQTLNPDIILCAIGREPVYPTATNIDFEKQGKYIKVNSNFETSIKNIYAIGDINGKMMLAHSAVHQAIGVIDYISENKPVHFDTEKIPSVIYGVPEIAWVGKTEKDLTNQNYKASTFPVSALGKAMADDEIDGFVKVLSVNNKIVGAHIISPEASSLVQQFALMIDNNIENTDILKTVFAHPTYSEAVFESILGLDKLNLSLPPQQNFPNSCHSELVSGSPRLCDTALHEDMLKKNF